MYQQQFKHFAIVAKVLFPHANKSYYLVESGSKSNFFPFFAALVYISVVSLIAEGLQRIPHPSQYIALRAKVIS